MNKDILNLNCTLDKMKLIGIYRTFHLAVAEYTFFSTLGRFTRVGHILGYETNLNKFKKIKILSSIISTYNGMELETRGEILENS
jgi:hypothetical protein